MQGRSIEPTSASCHMESFGWFLGNRVRSSITLAAGQASHATMITFRATETLRRFRVAGWKTIHEYAGKGNRRGNSLTSPSKLSSAGQAKQVSPCTRKATRPLTKRSLVTWRDVSHRVQVVSHRERVCAYYPILISPHQPTLTRLVIAGTGKPHVAGRCGAAGGPVDSCGTPTKPVMNSAVQYVAVPAVTAPRWLLSRRHSLAGTSNFRSQFVQVD